MWSSPLWWLIKDALTRKDLSRITSRNFLQAINHFSIELVPLNRSLWRFFSWRTSSSLFITFSKALLCCSVQLHKQNRIYECCLLRTELKESCWFQIRGIWILFQSKYVIRKHIWTFWAHCIRSAKMFTKSWGKTRIKEWAFRRYAFIVNVYKTNIQIVYEKIQSLMVFM